MNEMKYQMAFFLTAAFVISTALATTSTTEVVTETSTETVTETTSSAGATSAETTTTMEATTTSTRNISCHEYTCEYDGCIQNATDHNARATCYTPGYCFGRLTYNSTYWKEELGCEATTSSCLTTVHDNNGGRRICCSSHGCNSIAGLKLQSTSPGLSYSLGVVLSSLLLCLARF